MPYPVMEDYERCYRDFAWEIPERFNFGRDVVDAWAMERPDHPALIWSNDNGDRRVYSYAEMRALTDRFGSALRAQGVEKGDRVLIMLPRVPAWQIAMVACLKIGAIPIPCIEMLTARDVAYRLEHAEAKAAICRDVSVEKFAGAELQARFVLGAAAGWTSFESALAKASDRLEPAEMATEDPAILFYTSGSSGHPKGVLHAARGLYAWRISAQYWLDLSAEDRIWCTADTGWSKAGTSILFGPWSMGATAVFHDGGFDPQKRFEILAREKVTVFCASATELRRLLREDTGGRDLSALRQVVSAGEQVNPEIVRQWSRKFGTPLRDGYGQTECLMTVMNYPALPTKPGSAGKPLPGTEIAVLDETLQPIAGDSVGQLAIRLPNPQVMLGYWKNPEQTASLETEVAGVRYLLTSDQVSRDSEGYIFHAGRSDDVINSAGYRIGPMEVENALAEHPAVVESAVVASPDPDRGEVVKAFVVLREGICGDGSLIADIQAHCKSVTGPYKYPRKITFVATLPKTPTGKIRRRALRDWEFGKAEAPL